MLILNLETEDFTVTAKEHNSNNISDVLSITVKQRKTKKEINYSVKKELYAKVIKIILEKKKIENNIYTFEEVDLILSVMPQDPQFWFFPINNKHINKMSNNVFKEIDKYKKIFNIKSFNVAVFYAEKHGDIINKFTNMFINKKSNPLEVMETDNVLISLHVSLYIYLRILANVTSTKKPETKQINDANFLLQESIKFKILSLQTDDQMNNYDKIINDSIKHYSGLKDRKYYIFGICQEVNGKCNKCPLSNYYPTINNDNRTARDCYSPQSAINIIFKHNPDLLKYTSAIHQLITIIIDAIYRRLLFLLCT